MSFRVVRVLCCVLLLAFPASVLLAESQAAMVMVSGTAALNGTALAASTTIFAGDLLETSANSSLTINAKGSAILIGANARVRYFGDSIELQLGSTQVNTSKGMRVETAAIKIGPNTTSAKFRVDRTPHEVVISALAEQVRVDNNGDTRVLSPGTTATLAEKDKDQTPSPVRRPSNGIFFWVGSATVGTTALVVKITNHKRRNISNQIP